MTPTKRAWLSKGKGYFIAAGPQGRFIVFLIMVLGAYTLLLLFFQKLSALLQLPLFLPISLVTLFFFISIVGILYSHSVIGPLARIQRIIEQMAEGEMDLCLRLRETDDPLLKNLSNAITALCEHTRNAHQVIRDAGADLYNEIQTMSESIQRGVKGTELADMVSKVKQKQEQLERAIRSFRKA